MKSTRSPSWSERLLGFGPVAAPPHAFRVDARSIAYAGFRREGEVYTVAETAELPLAPDSFLEGPLGGPAREPERFREAVGELVGGLAHPPRDASLVLPDAWLRVAFTDLAEPPSATDRDGVLRWKLKRLVPFRVDELRLAGQGVAPLPQQGDQEPYRVLLGFAIESLLAQVEDAFAAAGIRLGRITSASLALVSAVAGQLADDTLTAVALVEDGGYSLVFARGANEGELDRIAEQIVREERRITALSEGLAAADLTQQNELVAFLNQRIAERTFGWSVLFDRLEELLPSDVRLVSLSPREIDDGTARATGRATSEQRFNLGIAGVAREPAAVLELIDALFADAAFRDPDIHQETFRDGAVGFSLDVVYLPEVAEALAGDGGPIAPTATAAAADSVLTAAAEQARREEAP